jgi:S-DNA-T family DNA segregation ATPase FtsK/SpoIIIE
VAEDKSSEKKLATKSGRSSKSKGVERKQPYEMQPEVWENFMDSLPPWFDEISAIILLVFGVISLMAILGVSSDATLANAWSNALKTVFGFGSVIVSLGIFAAGIVILLPKVGVFIAFPTRRILALEIGFVSVLAILHLFAGDAEYRAIARAGEGGGYIGWGVTFVPLYLFGETVTLIPFGALLIASVGIVLGVRRSHVSQSLQKFSHNLEGFGRKLTVSTEPSKSKTNIAQPESESKLSYNLDRPSPLQRRTPLMRIRPDPANLPPSQREALFALPVEDQPEQLPLLDDEVSERLDRVLSQSIEPPAKPGEIKVDYTEIIGKPLEAKKPKDPPLVQRPDGRIKRYFTAENMKEEKKVGKRDKDLPPLELLQDVEISPPEDDEINHNVVLIENTLLEFDIHIDIVDVKVGPTVTQYAVQPFQEVRGKDGEITKQRTRLSKIASLRGDLSLALSAKRLRLETPVPGHSYMGIEVPNKNPGTVALRSVMESKVFHDAKNKSDSPLLVPLGRDVAGVPIVVDIGEMPHVLIAGTTGSGKSVAIGAIAIALILNNMPDDVKLVMLDPKMVELSRFNGLPHLLGPVETDMERIIGVLRWCTREMDRRYKLLEEHAARNIQIFNSRLGKRRKDEHLPHIVIMIDEIGDLMMTKPEETEKTITRLAQMARAVGMHLVVATQRPSVDVITGLIKANFPTRISFAVASGVDSRVILDAVGAETLLGKGDMLYLAQDASGPRRLQGCYVADDEVRAVIQYWKDWHTQQVKAGKASAIRSGVGPWERGLTRREFLAETDPMLEEAIELVVEEQEASASLIQRRLGLGYPRAARIIDLLEELGVIGEPVAGGRSRKLLIEKGKDPFQELIDRRTKG